MGNFSLMVVWVMGDTTIRVVDGGKRHGGDSFGWLNWKGIAHVGVGSGYLWLGELDEDGGVRCPLNCPTSTWGMHAAHERGKIQNQQFWNPYQ